VEKNGEVSKFDEEKNERAYKLTLYSSNGRSCRVHFSSRSMIKAEAILTERGSGMPKYHSCRIKATSSRIQRHRRHSRPSVTLQSRNPVLRR